MTESAESFPPEDSNAGSDSAVVNEAAVPHAAKREFDSVAVRRHATWLALALILVLGGIFRFTGVNWDELQHLHPDERFLTMVTTGIQLPGEAGHQRDPAAGLPDWGGYFDTKCSPLNPYNRGFGNFVYGTFPLFLVKLVGEVLGKGGYDQVHLVGRVLSGLFDLFSVALIFFIGRRLYGKRVGLLAALLLAASVLNIQQSHFFTVDTFANVPLLLAFWFALDIADGRGGWRAYLLAGVFFGLALAARINLAPFAAIIALAGMLRLMQGVKITAVGLARGSCRSDTDRPGRRQPDVPADAAHRARCSSKWKPGAAGGSEAPVAGAPVASTPRGWLRLVALTFLGLIGAAVAAVPDVPHRPALRVPGAGAESPVHAGHGLRPQADRRATRHAADAPVDRPSQTTGFPSSTWSCGAWGRRWASRAGSASSSRGSRWRGARSGSTPGLLLGRRAVSLPGPAGRQDGSLLPAALSLPGALRGLSAGAAVGSGARRVGAAAAGWPRRSRWPAASWPQSPLWRSSATRSSGRRRLRRSTRAR